MLRSLVAPPGHVPTAVPAASDNAAPHTDFILRRNLTLESLETAMTEGDLMWIDIVDPSDDEIRWLEAQLHLHPVVVADLRREDQRPSLYIYPEYMFVSLFQAQIRLNKVESTEIQCIISDHVFVTVRAAESKAIDGAYDRAAQNADYWRRGISYFLYLTIQFVIDSYYPLLDRINNQLNKLEETVIIHKDKGAQQAVFRIKQQLITLRQMVAPQREVISNVIGEERLARSPENRDLFRHLYERLLRIYDVIDSQRDLTGNVLDLLDGQENARMANAVNRLTILSTIFLPLTFLVGLFGLNFVTTEPEFVISLPGAVLFAIILLMMIVMGGVMVWLFRRQGWL